MIAVFSAQLPRIMNIFNSNKRETIAIGEQIPFIEAKISYNIPTAESITRGITSAIPTQEEFDAQVEAGAAFLQTVSTPAEYEVRYNTIRNQFELAVATYNKNIRFLKDAKQVCIDIENTVQRTIGLIDRVLGKCNDIEKAFGSILNFIAFLSDFVPLLRILIGTAQIGLIAQVFPIAQGAITVKLGDAIKFAKSKLKEIEAIAKLADQLNEFIDTEVAKIRDELYPTRERLGELLIEIRRRRRFIDENFLRYLKELELSMSQNPPAFGGSGGPQGTGVPQDTDTIINLLSSQFEPEDILDNLENSNKERFIEYLVENGFTGYQVVKR